ncbi:Hypothetical predicted protein [Podarcis lilfordi]|uniref:Uncharacterized protein n=1 Tax=Podarcis lilfordi TaxID=74358 RepID=A0AA35PGF3_9SAUR|nr:Hypothetical predicted protein [Podarcis lilfordi]
MVPNACKSSRERFGSRNRRPFIKGKEISPRSLNRRKRFFEKITKPRSHNFSKNLTSGNSFKNGAKRLQMLPERFGSRNKRLFSKGQEISPQQHNRQKIFFEKIPKPRGHNFSKNLTFGNSLKNGAKRLQMLPCKVWQSKQKAFHKRTRNQPSIT